MKKDNCLSQDDFLDGFYVVIYNKIAFEFLKK